MERAAQNQEDTGFFHRLAEVYQTFLSILEKTQDLLAFASLVKTMKKRKTFEIEAEKPGADRRLSESPRISPGGGVA